MQVSVETLSELSRKMTVEVPEEKIQEKVASRLKSLSREVRIDGFRPGKAPDSVIKKRFGQRIREEVLADMIQSSFYDAIREEKLNPAASPLITAQESAEGQGLKYVADFEIMPDFVLLPLEAMEVSRFVSEVTEADVDDMVLRLREQRKSWREDEERAASKGDRLTICFEGKLGDESFTNGKVEDFTVILGSNQLMPGFEDNLIGTKRGSQVEFQVSFPDDYANAKLAGQTALFSVEVRRVEESVLPELNSDFVKTYGIEDGDEEAFRADIRANMEREMNRALRARTKTSVMDALHERNSSLTVPRVLVERELTHLLAPYKDLAKKQNQSVDEAQLKERFEPVAKRRVALGLVLNKLIENNRLSVDKSRVRAAIEDLAMSYENPEQVVNWYYSNHDQLSQVESMVLEEQVVDAVIAKAKTNDEKISFKELMQPSQEK